MVSENHAASTTIVLSSPTAKTVSKRTNHLYNDSDSNIDVQSTLFEGQTDRIHSLVEDPTYVSHEDTTFPPSANLRQGTSNIEREESAMLVAPEAARDRNPVPWRSLPRKDQLIILTLMRLAEPLVMTSLQAYVYFMLKSFDPEASDSVIAYQAGILTGSFTAAQCMTAVIWGRLADKEWMGRKNVLICGLLGTIFSSVGFGFSKSFMAAVLFRSLGGALNGNVGILRTVSNVFNTFDIFYDGP